MVVLNKTDLVNADELRDVEAAVRAINPARPHPPHPARRRGLDEVLDRGAFDLQRAVDNDPHFLEAHDHDHDHECGPDCDHDHHHHHDHHDHHHHDHGPSPIHDVTVQSVSLRAGEMDPQEVLPLDREDTQAEGPNILRLKGIIALKDDPDRYVVQGVHMIIEGDHQRAWKEGEKRESRLVFIGRELDPERLKRNFEACQAAKAFSGSAGQFRFAARETAARPLGAAIDVGTDPYAHRRPPRPRRPLRRRGLRRRHPAFRAGRWHVHRLDHGHSSVTVHDGLLAAVVDPAGERLVTGGEDGKVAAMGADGSVDVLADIGRKWIGAVAPGPQGAVAFASGRTAYVRFADGKLKEFAHPRSVEGVAFSPKGMRIGVARYNGATLHFPAAGGKPLELQWDGAHTGITFSPDGNFVVTTMQENALHGWKLSDGKHMRMSGYPAKVKSLSWSAKGRWLASSGAPAAIVWPFSGKDGPMGKAPLELGTRGNMMVTAVACHPTDEIVAVGYADGMVLAAASPIRKRCCCGGPARARSPGSPGTPTAAASPSARRPATAASSTFRLEPMPGVDRRRACRTIGTRELIGGVPAARIASLARGRGGGLRRSPPEDAGCRRQRRRRLSRRCAAALDAGLADALPASRRARGQGRRLIDVDGNRLDDFCLGDTGAMFGHSPPPVARAIRRQAGRGLTTMLPGEDAWRSEGCWERFGLPHWQIATTATDANRFALRVARAVTGRAKILVFNGCYHGAVDETMVRLVAASRPTGPGCRRVPRPDRAQPASSNSTTSPRWRRRSPTGDVACVITEPVLTNSCMVLPERLPRGLRDLTRRFGTLLLIDETHTISPASAATRAATAWSPTFRARQAGRRRRAGRRLGHERTSGGALGRLQADARSPAIPAWARRSRPTRCSSRRCAPRWQR